MKMKFSFDLHGVLNEKPQVFPEFFSTLTKLLVDNGHEVHVLTGARNCLALEEELAKCGVAYTHIGSLTSQLEEAGHNLNYDEFGNPHVPDDLWNPLKANYCEANGIHLHLDDTESYLDHFKTPCARYWSKDKPPMKRIKVYGKPPVKILI